MSDKFLEGRVALVTGASHGIGRHLALEIANRGAAVIVTYLTSREEAEAVCSEIIANGGQAQAEPLDVTSEDEIASLVGRLLQQHGRIEILINNVSHYFVRPISEVAPQQWRDVLETSVTATFLMCRAVLPLMVEGNFGRVVNIADSGADLLLPVPNITPYMIGKTGVLVLTKSLALQYAEQDITVNAVSPGIVETSVTKPAGGENAIPKQRFASLADISNAALFLLKPESAYVTGANIKVSGGWNL